MKKRKPRTEHNTALMQKRRVAWKAAGICVTCGSAPAEPNRTRCRDCVEKGREQRWKREYGITREDYEALLARQGYKCAICHGPVSDRGRNSHVDHDHATGVVRGVLCLHCNVNLGHYEKIKALGLAERFEQYLA